jgi:crotonobetainyl-CoA:carnitine CoA-transferase CaiB-like acyl-CoA transferase
VPSSAPAATIEISMQECVATLSQFTTVMWTHNRLVRSRHGNRWENLQPNAMYRCADGWFQASGIGKFWEPFTWMIGRPDLLEDSRFLTPELRTQNVAVLEEIINGALGDRRMREILTEAQETWRVPVGIGLSLAEVLDDPHLQSRDFWQETVVAGDVRVKTPGSPFTFAGEEQPAEPQLSDPVEPLALIAALSGEVE